jgi:hypothetical protein
VSFADAGPGDAGTPGHDSTVPPEASVPSDSPSPGEAGDAADATSPAATSPVDASPEADVSAALDSGPPSPPNGCAAGVPILVMTKVGTAVKFNTTGAVCVTLMGALSGWNASNVQGRSVTVVGSSTQTLSTIPEGANQPGLGAGPDGYVYWNFNVGLYTYASVTAFR